MLKAQIFGKYGYFIFSWLFILAGVLLSFNKPLRASPDPLDRVINPMSATTSFQSLSSFRESDSNLVQNDPLESPYPVPWNWIIQTQERLSQVKSSGMRYYRSPSLISPDGLYAAYTRIQIRVESELFDSRVSSTMFLENLETGELKSVRAESPVARDLFDLGDRAEMAGTVSILMPISWSEKGDRLLARQLEGLFSTSDVSDYAVIWERQSDRTTTISPNRSDYTTSILLGWDKESSQQVLFRAGMLGEEDWSVWSVALDGQTILADRAEPITYGQLVTRSWTGNQILR